MTIPKRTINEVVARLARERAVREIYVEGNFDRDLYRWVLDKLGITDVKVYPISTIEVPSDLLFSMQLTSGERQRVVAVADAVRSDLSLYSQVMFIIDSDTDYLLQCAHYLPPLYGTDGTSAELIIWKKDLIKKFFSLGLGCDGADRLVDSIFDFVVPIAESIFILRAVKEKLGKNWDLIDIDKAFSRSEDFSFERYCGKVGDKNGVRNQMGDDFFLCMESIKEKAVGLDSSKKMHGHDLFSVLARKLCLDGFSDRMPKDRNYFCRSIMTSAEWDAIRDDPTVAMIKSHFLIPLNRASSAMAG